MLRCITSLLLALGVPVLVPAIALAQPGTQDPDPAVAPVAAPPAAGAGQAWTDPRPEQGFVSPTARTQPAGAFTVHDRMVFTPGVTYGATDSLQLSLTTIAFDSVFGVLADAKVAVLRSRRLQVSLVGAATIVGEANRSELAAVLGGAVASACPVASCDLEISASLMFGDFAENSGSWRNTGIMYASITATARINHWSKWLMEAQALMPVASDDQDMPTLVPMIAGFRVHGRHISADIGLVFMAVDDEFSGWELVDGIADNIAVPWLTVAYRWP